MSFNETKTVLRAALPNLKGSTCSDAYKYFRSIGFPEAYDIDGDEGGDVEWFTYEEKIGAVVPVYDHDNQRWGIELILGKSNDYDSGHFVSFSLIELKEKVGFLNDQFGNLKWKLFSYTWYNGGQEPIKF